MCKDVGNNVRIKYLYSIILKLKEKGALMNQSLIIDVDNHTSDRMNLLTCQLITKQDEIDQLKNKQGELENELKEVKKIKVNLEKDSRRKV